MTWAGVRRIIEGDAPSWPDALARWVMLFGWVPIAVYPGLAPRWAADAWIGALVVLWLWGRWILKPWRPDPE